MEQSGFNIANVKVENDSEEEPSFAMEQTGNFVTIKVEKSTEEIWGPSETEQFYCFELNKSIKSEEPDLNIWRERLPNVDSGTKSDESHCERQFISNDMGRFNDGNAVFNCSLCAYKSDDKINLSVHYSAMHEGKDCSCEHCNFNAEPKAKPRGPVETLDEGIEENPEIISSADSQNNEIDNNPTKVEVLQKRGGKHFCSVCGYKTVKKSNLVRHKYIHDRIEKNISFECDKCDFKATDKRRLISHIFSIHENFNCSLCGMKFKQKMNLIKHLSFNHNEFACAYCEYVTSENGDLSRHMSRVHKEKKLFACSMCDYKTEKRGNLTRHVNRRHRPAKEHPCGKCDRNYGTEVGVVRHISWAHKGEKYFVCSQCDYKTNKNSNLIKHLTRGHKEKEYPCMMCDETYLIKWQLMRHIALVHGEKNDVSSRHYKFGPNLERPDVVQLGYKEDKETDPCLVKRHVMQLMEIENPGYKEGSKILERMFSCDLCNNKYLSQSSLEYHKKMHQEKGPLKNIQCPHCDVKFSRKSNVNRHIAFVHEGRKNKNIECPKCGHKVGDRRSLRLHMEAKH